MCAYCQLVPAAVPAQSVFFTLQSLGSSPGNNATHIQGESSYLSFQSRQLFIDIPTGQPDGDNPSLRPSSQMIPSCVKFTAKTNHRNL